MTDKKSLFDGWNSAPNIVTYIRIIMMVAFLYFAANAGYAGTANVTYRWIAAVLFIVAASTDKLDGYLARKYNQVTELGKLMDPIADKLLICGALIVLSINNEVWWIVTILFLVREIGITVMRFFVIDTGGKVIAASNTGKLKTLTQCIGIGMILLPIWTFTGGTTSRGWTIYAGISVFIILLALFFCLYSGGEYLINTFANAPTSGVSSSKTSNSVEDKE
ncbi:CDP-diacylglycerol--glycerol-3-phosphate 3-phosphatidyltransferase [Alloscardovia theropitheci]|uniref:CDP-diacylglycerol--glycerol-3-phosphate 3-phosphatidyltransferase n=1 Tax=Alloscardovia theropitheci TaxID=2496842 RepID=A0A4R0QWN2_9BIFI|nr:CDP-diacylglycerol--glycerol-3-phosphate 3-phosphatidyltransferase [Alloscardovia theropitheci]TCD54847.1 CDP-diacylglycerol--glycerol-3-phosphate 3-phosphatidyltransferase [Alloscardovia theropitheci]